MRAAVATRRYWLPIVAGFVLLIATAFVGVVAAWIMLMAAFGLILDGATKLWERAGSTGNLTTHRQ